MNMRVTASSNDKNSTGRTYGFTMTASNARPSRILTEDAGRSIWENTSCAYQNIFNGPFIKNTLISIGINAVDFANSEGPPFVLMQPYEWLVRNNNCPVFDFPCYQYRTTIFMRSNANHWTWAALFYPLPTFPSGASFAVLAYLEGPLVGTVETYTSSSSQPIVSPIENEDYPTGWVIF
jgi:hypothetical protein